MFNVTQLSKPQCCKFLHAYATLSHFCILSLQNEFWFLKYNQGTARLQLGRTWNSYSWIAWRKLCWMLPLAVIVFIALYSEHELVPRHRVCIGGIVKFVHYRLSEFGRTEAAKINFIWRLPTYLHWFVLFLCTLHEARNASEM